VTPRATDRTTGRPFSNSLELVEDRLSEAESAFLLGRHIRITQRQCLRFRELRIQLSGRANASWTRERGAGIVDGMNAGLKSAGYQILVVICAACGHRARAGRQHQRAHRTGLSSIDLHVDPIRLCPDRLRLPCSDRTDGMFLRWVSTMVPLSALPHSKSSDLRCFERRSVWVSILHATWLLQ